MVEVLEVLLMATVYSESRRTALAPRVNNSRWGGPVGARFLGETPPPRGGETGRAQQFGECPLRSAGLGEFLSWTFGGSQLKRFSPELKN